MWLRNTSPYPDTEVDSLVEFATQPVDMDGVCVNVKGGSRRGGRAYCGVPEISNAPRAAQYLVTIKLGNGTQSWPIEQNRDRSTRWPKYACNDWRELLVIVAAHEAKHVEQFRKKLSRSELQCEWFAAGMLEEYRRQSSAPGTFEEVSQTPAFGLGGVG